MSQRQGARHRDSHKTLSNNVVALDADGREIGIVFETTAPFDTPREMEALVAKALHPFLTVAVFIVVLLAIHPFQDANGRLSRVVTTLFVLGCCSPNSLAGSHTLFTLP
ncbi:Fic family protein [Bradyrhizobium sp. LHD-71]|uniref:Fic family protein n=1 Tax=Bradyrhizobium sp. LHD-71 TaxID=3072141 RepID=UPI00280E2A8F|nr:Fic family protein [Bradyrhizobium sp. LHD-71]MDQ8727471.1 Fic family protein [Bradyrhizobium sp. LHD-71]